VRAADHECLCQRQQGRRAGPRRSRRARGDDTGTCSGIAATSGGKTMVKGIITGLIVWVITNGINEIAGGHMIQQGLMYLWGKFSFEIITLFVVLFVLVCIQLYRVHSEYQSLKAWIGIPTSIDPKVDKRERNLIGLIENNIERKLPQTAAILDKKLELFGKEKNLILGALNNLYNKYPDGQEIVEQLKNDLAKLEK